MYIMVIGEGVDSEQVNGQANAKPRHYCNLLFS
jgi:hypothetical protein